MSVLSLSNLNDLPNLRSGNLLNSVSCFQSLSILRMAGITNTIFSVSRLLLTQRRFRRCAILSSLLNADFRPHIPRTDGFPARRYRPRNIFGTLGPPPPVLPRPSRGPVGHSSKLTAGSDGADGLASS